MEAGPAPRADPAPTCARWANPPARQGTADRPARGGELRLQPIGTIGDAQRRRTRRVRDCDDLTPDQAGNDRKSQQHSKSEPPQNNRDDSGTARWLGTIGVHDTVLEHHARKWTRFFADAALQVAPTTAKHKRRSTHPDSGFHFGPDAPGSPDPEPDKRSAVA